jgi:hypothetical protein
MVYLSRSLAWPYKVRLSGGVRNLYSGNRIDKDVVLRSAAGKVIRGQGFTIAVSMPGRESAPSGSRLR